MPDLSTKRASHVRTVELVEAHIGPLQTLMTSQGSQGAGTHMGVEGRSRDSAVFTAITHMWNLINQKGECCQFNLHSAVTAFYNLKLATGWLSSTLLASAVFVWLLLPCFAFGPLSAKLVPSHACCHQRSKGLRHPDPLSTPVILVSRPITGATTCPNRQCHNFTWSHFWRRAPFSPFPLLIEL